MTVLEMSNEFDILYDSIANKSAPGLDSYEKSVYLTKAQLEIVKNYYDSLSNRKQTGFEATEKRRVDLKELVKTFTSVNPITNNNKISDNSRFYIIPEEVFLIIYEKAYIMIPNCEDSAEVNIIPKTHDEYNIQKKNPFKKPDNKQVWRLDISRQNNNKVVELISPFEIDRYFLRYIKYPRPIILSDLTLNYPNENLSIDGFTGELSCQLDNGIHREILDRAVELAFRDYKIEDLQSKIQIDTRNE